MARRNTQVDVLGHKTRFDVAERTKPADQGPYSPAKFDKWYNTGRASEFKDGDGMSAPSLHACDVAEQRPQFMNDGHLVEVDDYDYSTGRRTPDKKTSGFDSADTRGWVRSPGESARGYPGYDPNERGSGFRYKSCAPEKGGKSKASGQDEHKSPFSAAYRKGSGEGF